MKMTFGNRMVFAVVKLLLCMLIVVAWSGHHQTDHRPRTKEVTESSLVFFPCDEVSVHNVPDESEPFIFGGHVFPYFFRDTCRASELVNVKRFVWRDIFPVQQFLVGVVRFRRVFPLVRNKGESATDYENFGGSTPLVFPKDSNVSLFRVCSFCALGLFDENPRTLRIYDRLSLRTSRSSVLANWFVLASDSVQGPQGSNNCQQPYENKSPICPEAGPPWGWPVLRLAIGCVCLFTGAWMIVRFGYGRIRLGVCGSFLLAVGWLLLLAPGGW